MRHLLSLLLGLVIAPAVWAVAGYGQSRLAQASDAGLPINRAMIAVAVLVAAGLAYGLIAATRISPLGPLVAGLVLIGAQLAYVVRPGLLPNLLPRRVEDFVMLPVENGTTAVLGAGLLVAVLSVARWRRWPRYEEDGFLSDAATIGAPTPRKAFEDALSQPFGTPGQDATRAFAGAATGYAADERTRQGGWPSARDQAWPSASGTGLEAESERTTRIPTGPTAPGPWTDPPQR